MEKITLDKLKIGKIGKVIKLNNNSNIKRRLLDIGLVPNSLIEAYLESPFKDPIAYKIKNAIIAIRKKDALEIEVEEL